MGSVWEARAGVSHRFDQPTRCSEGDENPATGSGTLNRWAPQFAVRPDREMALPLSGHARAHRVSKTARPSATPPTP